LIAVGSGFETKNSRSRQSKKLLTWGLTNFDTIKIAEINKEISRLQVWLGNKNEVQVYVKEDIYKTIPKARKKYLKAYIQYDGPILAPIKKNQKVGVLKVLYKDEIINEYQVYAFEDIKKLNIISRIIKSINYLIWGDV
jgi:D-alanyl-D-alanine carboxypeptidase (penicillin-binding protein 5/6)